MLSAAFLARAAAPTVPKSSPEGTWSCWVGLGTVDSRLQSEHAHALGMAGFGHGGICGSGLGRRRAAKSCLAALPRRSARGCVQSVQGGSEEIQNCVFQSLAAAESGTLR